MKYELPKLPYAYDALEPWIDARTMELHHTKHHATYVEKLNAALAKHPEIAEVPLETLLADFTKIPDDIRTAVRNHGGGHYNHSIFWTMIGPHGSVISAGVEKALTDGFGSVEKFKEAFTAGATGHFGSGWCWLVANEKGKMENGKLQILTTPNQDTPLAGGFVPLLGLDVWEHAYYLKYQNKRADYVTAWWNAVNWSAAGERLGA